MKNEKLTINEHKPFEIKVNVGSDTATSSIQAFGSLSHVITDLERTTFNIQDENLKNLVEKHFGEKPDDAYVCSPTPWDDLYKRYNWPQVQLNLDVFKTEIVGVVHIPTILKTQKFKNSSKIPADFNVSIKDEERETSQNTWSSSSTVSAERKISYNISFMGVGAGGEAALKYEQTFGQSRMESKMVIVGSTAGVSVRLNPGEEITAELSASRGTMKVRITYKAYLTGMVVVNYGDPYKGHHFWAFDIGSILNAGNISNSVKITEDIEIEYFENAEIHIIDASGNRTLVYNPSIQPGITI